MTVEPAPIRISAALAPRLNLAAVQNAVPALRELAIDNRAGRPLTDLRLELVATPAFLAPRSLPIAAIAADGRFELAELDLALDAALFGRLTEAEPAELTLRLVDAAGAVLSETRLVTELLPRTHWAGLGHWPELVAAQVLPNDPAVARILKSAAATLEAHCRSGALDGYAGGAVRAFELASAIWSAVAGLGLSYALPPASFEQTGQKVRSPAQIEADGLATCLDTALLFAAALEQAGLHALIVFTRGHAFTGLWLQPESFAGPVVDDVSALRKRLQLDQLRVFETTLVTGRPPAGFRAACEHATAQLAVDADFRLAVDVARARQQRIRPLATESATPVDPASPDTILAPAFEPAPALDPLAVDATLPPEAAGDRLQRWQRRLLDLSLRNALLNFRPGKKALLLDAPEPAQLEDRLARGERFKLLPELIPVDPKDPRSATLLAARDGVDLRREAALQALSRRELHLRVPEAELEARLVQLFRDARGAMQEGGANTLFLAFGFLLWKRADKDAKPTRAPLVLLPVHLERRSVRGGFTLTAHEDEARFNPTLIEMLRQDFELSLGLDGQVLPRDEAGLDIAAVWRQVAHAVRELPGWEVQAEVGLALFSFAKHLMWKDLVDRTAALRENPVVRHLLDTPREPYAGGGDGATFPEARRLDRDFPPTRTWCPLPTDGSQLAAVMAAAQGHDFVLIGPPGTGKSQTITNLIAQTLAEGKTVLFVAEKIAALEVVYRRLQAIGIGEFCLELHSSKARKAEVLAQLKGAQGLRGSDPSVEAHWQAEAERLGRQREALSGYVERLHERHGNGLSVFGAIGRVLADAALPVLPLHFEGGVLAVDAARLEALAADLSRAAVLAGAAGVAQDEGPLGAIGVRGWTPAWQQGFLAAVATAESAAAALESAAARWQSASGVPVGALAAAERAAWVQCCAALPALTGVQAGFLLTRAAETTLAALADGAGLLARHRALCTELAALAPEALLPAVQDAASALQAHAAARSALPAPWSAPLIEALRRALELLRRRATLKAGLSVRYGVGVSALPVAQLQRRWITAGQAWVLLRWWQRRGIRLQLEAVIEGAGEPAIEADLARLVELRDVDAELAGLPALPLPAGVWRGVDTPAEALVPLLAEQQALAAAAAGLPVEASALAGLPASAQTAVAALAEASRRLVALAPQLTPLASIWRGAQTELPLWSELAGWLAERLQLAARGAPSAAVEAACAGRYGPQLAADATTLLVRTEIEARIAAMGELQAASGGLWRGLDSDAERLAAVLAAAPTLRAAASTLLAQTAERETLGRALLAVLGSGQPAPLAQPAADFHATLGVLEAALTPLFAAGEFAEAVAADWRSQPLAELAVRLAGLRERSGRLRPWCGWLAARAEAEVAGLGALTAAVADGRLPSAQLVSAFQVNHARQWLEAVVAAEPLLKDFLPMTHEHGIREFRRIDERFQQLTRQWLRARLMARIPAEATTKGDSGWATLNREFAKKQRHLPLRELVNRAGPALLQLTPCLLMSPLSVAQYLAPGSPAFDLVIFDEASQIPVWDAIGAIARGRQVVMVGDPKQLPPTSFFDRASHEPEDLDIEEDLESILDECLGARLPQRELAWHYRSRHESLIAFSNHRYYGGGLITFPSPVTDDRAVSFHPVDGVYAKGGARTNLIEARALVADLVATLRAQTDSDMPLSIGVVSFNAEQQGLIEDLLDQERRQDPALERWFDESQPEPVFVKNLESVQGDERDLIYFSITYGPDAQGRVAMQFGPLNREGGHRRLNVAITRARVAMKVYSSLKPEQMDLSRTAAKGVADLKHFLDYAMRGAVALPGAACGRIGVHESPFEAAVAAALEARGWQLHPQVGVSSFRIDLGVVHPDAPGRYLCGLECDGATYHRSATARDRDLLREQVLKGLGWTLVRIWSTDWWQDRDGALARTVARLDALLADDRARRPSPAVLPGA